MPRALGICDVFSGVLYFTELDTRLHTLKYKYIFQITLHIVRYAIKYMHKRLKFLHKMCKFGIQAQKEDTFYDSNPFLKGRNHL